MKPAVYLTGLSNGLTLGTPLKDQPIRIRGQDGQIWTPQNYDRKFRQSVPPLLFSDGWRMPKREFWRLRGPILTLAVGLVLFTVVRSSFRTCSTAFTRRDKASFRNMAAGATISAVKR